MAQLFHLEVKTIYFFIPPLCCAFPKYVVELCWLVVKNVIAYPSGAHEFTIGFRGVRVAQSLVLYRSLFVFLSFFFWPLCCLSFFWLPLCYLQAFLVFHDLEYTQRGRRSRDLMIVLSSNTGHGKVHSIQQYVIKLVINLRQVCGFLRVLRLPPPIKLTATKELKYCWKWL